MLVTILVLFFTAGTRAIVFTNLYTFSPGTFNTPTAGGYYPQAGLLLFSNALYGTTAAGGSNNVGTVFTYPLAIGVFTNLYTFTGSNGVTPQADLVASGKTLFGTTSGGGTSGDGTIFAVNTTGTGFTTLYNFSGGWDGAAPYDGLLLSGNTLYGTTSSGGGGGNGTVFALSLGPIPLCIEPNSGNVVLCWGNPTFSLQSAPTVNGPYTTVPNAASPWTNAITGS